MTISWLQDGRTRTMRSDTLRALTYGNDALTGGAVAVKVLGSDGKGQPGLPVTLAPSPTGPVVGTSTTDDDGCVVFAGRTAGNYRATVTTGGYVDVDGNSIASSGEFGIVGGQTTSTTITYEKAAALAVSLSGAQDATATVPALLPMTMYNTDRWSGTQYRVYRDCTIVGGALCFTGNAGPTPPPNTVRSTAGLFPANYKFWPGNLHRRAADLVGERARGGRRRHQRRAAAGDGQGHQAERRLGLRGARRRAWPPWEGAAPRARSSHWAP
ncbi:hypothetical protein GCM10025868_03810 [Angustibacter aerolatus]|uniref:Carboxypeptidase regulatory-like domain-containing protein n=1 Tax=Angustibacter aerolatus TaxID=1162965 RepID=A0ABQ6JEC1_9ACTN|nr:carboxypeptidase-like regulatory domain-containing protein [Angustibacter aerolatus]GMA85131.1 hypothetical protein GCM10025868_03810 [Angustibacter aerolatus]